MIKSYGFDHAYHLNNKMATFYEFPQFCIQEDWNEVFERYLLTYQVGLSYVSITVGLKVEYGYL